MSVQDVVVGALCAWKENRGGQPQPEAMQSILNVLVNRAKQRGTDIYTEAIRPEQFSSLTVKNDPEIALWPADSDPQWKQALLLAQDAESGALVDLTSGSTLYYDPAGLAAGRTVLYTLPNGKQTVFPEDWNQSVVTFQCEIASQLFFSEA